MFSNTETKNIWRLTFQPILDFLSIVFGAGLVYLIRYRWFDEETLLGFQLSGTKQIERLDYFYLSIALALAVIVIYSLLGLYEVNRKQNWITTFFQLFLGIFSVLLAIITFFFFNEFNRDTLPEGVPISRFILGTGGFVTLYCVVLARLGVWAVEQLLYKLGYLKSKVILVGKNNAEIGKWLASKAEVALIYTYAELNPDSFTAISDLVKFSNISEIYLFSTNHELETKLASLAELNNVDFLVHPTGVERYGAFGTEFQKIQNTFFLRLKHTNLDGWMLVWKRLVDIVGSLILLIATSPILIITAIAIRLESKGMVIYFSERIGPDGKVFKLWKFRRYYQEYNTSESDPNSVKALELEAELIKKSNMRDDILYKIKDDPRQTKVGAFIEKYSIDELPQFINVLLGSMSLVGPRPHQPREVAKYKAHHLKVLNIKPGITGLAQVNGRSDLSFEGEVLLDVHYLENWSFWLDLWILMKTPFVIIFSRHNQ
jgi:exopolysaccharide biosynthesis polyprenyl glycosylphosphotransferase